CHGARRSDGRGVNALFGSAGAALLGMVGRACCGSRYDAPDAICQDTQGSGATACRLGLRSQRSSGLYGGSLATDPHRESVGRAQLEFVVASDLNAFVSRLKSIERRMDVSDNDLMALFWQAHVRFQFFKSLRLVSTLLDIGA